VLFATCNFISFHLLYCLNSTCNSKIFLNNVPFSTYNLLHFLDDGHYVQGISQIGCYLQRRVSFFCGLIQKEFDGATVTFPHVINCCPSAPDNLPDGVMRHDYLNVSGVLIFSFAGLFYRKLKFDVFIYVLLLNSVRLCYLVITLICNVPRKTIVSPSSLIHPQKELVVHPDPSFAWRRVRVVPNSSTA